MCRRIVKISLVCVLAAAGQPVDVVPVRSQAVERNMVLTGEILPYQRVTLHARVNGYVDRVLVDRGSAVKAGQLLVSLPLRN